MKWTKKNSGISIIGTVFTMVMLGVMGAALVALVAADQESRMTSIHREHAFYAIQAGLEYALREIKEGGYPIVVNKTIGTAKFTNVIDAPNRRITSTGSESSSTRSNSITTANLGSDCLTINTVGATLGGPGNNQILGITLTKTCLDAINIDKITLQWTPESNKKMMKIRIGGVDVYNDPAGVSSGVAADVIDYKIATSAAIDFIEFSSSIAERRCTMTVTLTDSSSKMSEEFRP